MLSFVENAFLWVWCGAFFSCFLAQHWHAYAMTSFWCVLCDINVGVGPGALFCSVSRLKQKVHSLDNGNA